MLRLVAPALAACAAAFLAACGGGDDGATTADCVLDSPSQTLVYEARSLRGGYTSPAAVDLTARRICERIRSVRADGVGVRRRGENEIDLQLSGADALPQLDQVSRIGLLTFYDWEPNVFGNPGAPVVSLGQAVERASKQKPRAEKVDIPPDG